MKPACMLLLLTGTFVPSAFADDKPNRITIATWNVEWFFDAYKGDNSSDLSKEQSAPSRDEWQWKLSGVANVIAQMKPTILALQEIENRNVLRQLTKLLSEKHGLKYRIAYVQGWDNFTEQDVAIIYRSGLVQYSCREQSSEMFNSKEYYNLNKHLFAKFEWGKPDDKESLTILNVHLRATPEKHELREKQCRLIWTWLKDEIENGNNVVVLGDMNTEEAAGTITQGSDMAIVSGWQTKTESDDLLDLNQFLSAESRGTHLGGGQFDRILVSKSMLENKQGTKDLLFSRIANFKKLVLVGRPDNDHFNQFYNIPQDQRDISDHYPIMAVFDFK